MLNRKIPNVIFKTRVRDETLDSDNPYRWQDVTTEEYFFGKRSILFSLPGAFTPTCSTFQLPDYERLYGAFTEKGIDDIFCISVNDAYVMNAWGKSQSIQNVKLIPDGSGEFTRKMSMLVYKNPEGFGMRSWRYAALVEHNKIAAWFEEPGFQDDCPDDPYGASAPQAVLDAI